MPPPSEKADMEVEEALLLSTASSSSLPRPERRRRFASIVLGTLLVFLYYRVFSPQPASPLHAVTVTAGERKPTSGFRWGDITPSPELAYHDCYDGLQCARLEVPMDYHRADGKGRKIAVAVARRPAKVPVTDPRYGGAVLINPGGPGGSGVALLLRIGAELQQVLDSDVDPALSFSVDDRAANSTEKYFDLIGFDPRGINLTTPLISCFPDSFSRQAWNLQDEAEGILGSSENSLRLNWRRAKAMAEGCSATLATPPSPGEEALAEHVNTTPVTEDMVRLIEAHGAWREETAKRLASDIACPRARAAALSRTRWRRGAERLQYWGFSYGTIIGATFAARHPERIGRMALDGVVDADLYYRGIGDGNLQDADAILTRFFEYCVAAGPLKCPFSAAVSPSVSASEELVQALRAAYEDLLDRIYDDPLSVPGDAERGPEVITWTDVKLIVKTALYQPLWGFPILAQLLADLPPWGNGTAFATFKAGERSCVGCRSAQCIEEGPYGPDCVAPGWDGADASRAILCSDAAWLGDVADEDAFRLYWHQLRNQSAAIGDYWAHTRLGCVGWTARARWRFMGPFAAAAAAAADPSRAILWLGNELDAVTPIRNAWRMAAAFAGSAVLVQRGEGHCTLSAPSLCTVGVVRRYFQRGVLPPEGMVCEVDERPLVGVAGGGEVYTRELGLLRRLGEGFWEGMRRGRRMGVGML